MKKSRNVQKDWVLARERSVDDERAETDASAHLSN